MFTPITDKLATVAKDVVQALDNSVESEGQHTAQVETTTDTSEINEIQDKPTHNKSPSPPPPPPQQSKEIEIHETLDTKKMSTKELQKALAESKKRESHLALQFESAQEALRTLKEEFQKTQQKEQRRIELLKKERDELRNKMKSDPQGGSSELVVTLKEEGEKLSKDIGVKAEKIKELSKIKKELESRLEDANASNEQLLSKEKELTEIIRKMSSDEQSYKETISSLQNSNSKITEQLKNKDQDIQKLTTQLNDIQMRSDEGGKLLKQITTSQLEMAAMRESKLEEEMQSLQRRFEIRLNEMQMELEATQKRALQAESKVAQISTLVPEATQPLLEQIRDMEEHKFVLEKELRQYKQIVEDWKSYEKNSKITMDNMQKEILDNKKKYDSMLIQKDQFAEEIKKLNLLISVRDKEISDLQSEKLKQVHISETLEKELNEVKAQLKEQIKELEDYKNKSDELIEKLNKKLLTPIAINRQPSPPPVRPKPTNVTTLDPKVHNAASLQATIQMMADAKDTLQKELYKYVLENKELANNCRRLKELERQYGELEHKHLVLLELMGEREEQYQLLLAKMDENSN